MLSRGPAVVGAWWAVLGVLLEPATAASPARKSILIGVEYAPPGLAKPFAELAVPVAKHYPDAIPWGAMQRSAGARIDFSVLDRFVREYQAAGFRELVIVLKAKSAWASIDPAKNFAPKPEHFDAFDAWVRAVVERYDRDGKDDMPGLRWPVRYYELGSEFSTFEPTPTDDYVAMLSRAHRSAHVAFARVILSHAAFLTTTTFRDRPTPARYAAAFASVDRRIMHKSLADIRKVLDRPDCFDAVNFRALGDPYEIESTASWLKWEMRQRKYTKPLVITDTTPTPFIAWGPATRDKGPLRGLGIVVPPATEADRPRLARYFTKLVDGDADTEAWTHAFVAADMIKKVVVAAEQGVELINTSFMEDLWPFKTKLAQAGAGTSAWAGMVETKTNLLTHERTVLARRVAFYAVARLQFHLRDYDTVERVSLANKQARVYRFAKGPRTTWVAWLEPSGVLLPGDKVPSASIDLPASAAELSAERMIDRTGVTRPDVSAVVVRGGAARLILTPIPVFVTVKR